MADADNFDTTPEINETTNLAEIDEPIQNKALDLVAGLAGNAVQAAGVVKSAAGQAAKAAQDGLGGAAAAAEERMRQMRLARYNPIFPEQLFADDFDLPNLIVIVDGDQRKGIDVCEGAVGWMSIKQKMEVLHLYKDAAPRLNVCFYPVPKFDTAYFVDPYDETRYIDVASYVDTMKNDAFTELKHVAYLLGAKRCRLELAETTTLRGNIGAPLGTKESAKAKDFGSATAEQSLSGTIDGLHQTERKIEFEELFEGGADPIRPTLTRLAHDSEILHLIETRCNTEGNISKRYTVRVSSASLTSMSVGLARKIDFALKSEGVSAGAEASGSLSTNVSRELQGHMHFIVEF